jgi:hypothetical protein
MTAKEIHDNLLSLFVRGLGVWLLYLALSGPQFISVLDTIYTLFYTLFVPDPKYQPNWEYSFFDFVELLVAAYFILGAPPFLKAATCGSAPKE